MAALHLLRRLSSAVRRGFREEELKQLCKAESPTRAYLPSPESVISGGGLFKEKRMVVLMVGWAQSSQKVLSKYAAFYTGLGLPCLAMALSIQHFWFSRRGNNATQNVLSLLDNSLQQPASLLLHTFSGGGIVIFPQFLSEHERPNSLFASKIVPVGMIFDSGPSNFAFRPGLEAAKLVYQQGGYNILTYALASSFGILTDVVVGPRKRAGRVEALEHARLLQMPQLYLYSRKDTVCLPETVEEVMEGQKRKGREVSSQCWEDSQHVRHFTKHPEEYTRRIVDFIQTLKTPH